ncbi:serine/threonine-protein kinase [Shewanella waksmanii]|uniref:serine/threonine-protein kinase n=1 Tax=Shewanella waksmanii TaxID=213783 RepID=UPI00048CB289|nr:serine/threonine-protein kinase [Shewanella waksmanii]
MDKLRENAPAQDDKTLIAGIDSQDVETSGNLVGQCFKNRYLIESHIGSGGMSDIYKAKDLHFESAGITEPYVAIKVLLPQYSSTPEAKQVLVREARKTQQLSHPNIIRVYDVDSDGEHHFLVMEWLDGESLDQVIKRSRPLGINFSGVIKIITQISSALEYTHKQGIVHTDLKPSNIILTRQGQIKVFDFGVAKALQLNFDKYAVQNHQNTSPLSGFTPAYASLEQLEGQDGCAADDVFAFSCIVYELLSSKHPYQRLAANQVDLSKIELKKPKNINWLLWPVLKKGLALHKQDRAPSVDSIARRLASSKLPLISATAAAIAVIILGGVFYQSQQNQLSMLNQLVAVSAQQQQKLTDYQQLSAQQLLSQFSQMTDISPLTKHGLLALKQPQVMAVLARQIEQVPRIGKGHYRNFAEINKILATGSQLYPDSATLAKMQGEVDRNQQSVLDALSDRLNVLLAQGRYAEMGDNDIAVILNDMQMVQTGYSFVPDDAAFSLYQSRFEQALSNHDIKTIAELNSVGELLFVHHQQAQALLDHGQRMTVAVKAINSYTQAVSQGVDQPYPYAAAEVYYLETFNELSAQLDEVATPKELHAFDGVVTDLATNLPQDFQPLLKLEKRVAATYLRFANIYMEKQYFKTARDLIARGNELFERLDGV